MKIMWLMARINEDKRNKMGDRNYKIRWQITIIKRDKLCIH